MPYQILGRVLSDESTKDDVKRSVGDNFEDRLFRIEALLINRALRVS